MKSPFSKTAALFFTPETLLPFLFGSVFLAVLGNAVWQILIDFFLKRTHGNTMLAAAQIALGALLIFTLSILLFARSLQRLEPRTLADARTPQKHRGLILLVSREEPCQVAIEYHLPTLERCWLFCSEQTLPIAKNIEQTFAKSKVSFRLIQVNNVYDPMELYHQVRHLYNQLPPNWQPQQIITDYTGMTAMASVGAVLASLYPSPNAPLQYTPADPNRTGKSLTPIETVLRSSLPARPRSREK